MTGRIVNTTATLRANTKHESSEPQSAEKPAAASKVKKALAALKGKKAVQPDEAAETNNAPTTDEDGARDEGADTGETNQPVDVSPEVLSGKVTDTGTALNVLIVIPTLTGHYNHKNITLQKPVTVKQLGEAIAALK